MKKLNFTVGPVMTYNYIKKIGKENIPYFRNKEFSELMLDNRVKFIEFLGGKSEDEIIFLTGSGTLAMEATIKNFINRKSKVLVVNGGTFGNRFLELCNGIAKPIEYKLDYGTQIDLKVFEKLIKKNKIDTLLIQSCETSTGIKYPLDKISKICKKYDILMIVDAISGFIADEIKYDWFDILITSSQKALALPPGMSFIYIKENRIIDLKKVKGYLDFSDYIDNIKRGQTPFTPAVQTCLMLNKRLKKIDKNQVKRNCEYFRYLLEKEKIPLKYFLNKKDMSNCCTALYSENISSQQILEQLNDKGIQICPNGGDLKDIFRIGHLGNITKKDIKKLIRCLKEICK